MKRLLSIVLLGILLVAGFSYSQEIPDGLKEYVYQLKHDPDAEYGFNYAKKRRYIEHDVQFNNWFVGLPIELYKYNSESLENFNENREIIDFFISRNTWRIPIRIDGKYIYHVKVLSDKGKIRAFGCGEGVIGFNTWDKVRKKYPENTGIRPIVIGIKNKFIHFPNEKKGKSMFYVKNPKLDNEISSMTSRSLDTLDEDKKIIKYWKKNWDKNKEKRREFIKKHPDLFKDRSGGSK